MGQGVLYWSVGGEVGRGIILVRHGDAHPEEEVRQEAIIFPSGDIDFEFAYQPPFNRQAGNFGIFLRVPSIRTLTAIEEKLGEIFGPETHLLEEWPKVEVDDVEETKPPPPSVPDAGPRGARPPHSNDQVTLRVLHSASV